METGKRWFTLDWEGYTEKLILMNTYEYLQIKVFSKKKKSLQTYGKCHY